MEYEEAGGDGRFDLVALRWDSTGAARKKEVVTLAIIEVKQGYNAVRTSIYEKDGKQHINPGLKKHQQDFISFISKESLTSFCEDMAMIFKQKCELGLILAEGKIPKLTQESPLVVEGNIDFICLLANYKKASKNLRNELTEMDSCRFIRSHYMGYGLYADEIFTITSETI
jgi:hypothetical protein